LKNKLILFLLVSYIAGTTGLYGQEARKEGNLLQTPRITGMAPPKGISLDYELVQDYQIFSHSDEDYYPEEDEIVNRNRRINFSLKAPILNRKKIKLVYGFQYSHEEFRFKKPGELNYPFYQSLEDKSLKSLGNKFYFMFPTGETSFLALNLNINLNGDYYRKDHHLLDFLKISAAPFWGIKKQEDLMYGFGLAYTYTFGKPGISPVIGYYKTFNSKWGVEAMLPVEARLRHNINNSNILYLGAKTRGAGYNIHLDDIDGDNIKSYELHHSEIKFSVSWHRKITGLLWISADLGYRYNLNFNLKEAGKNTGLSFIGMSEKDYILESALDDAIFFKLSMYLVPPKKH